MESSKQRIVVVSRVLRLLSIIGMLCIPVVIGLIWLLGSEPFLLSGETAHYLLPHGVGFEQGLLDTRMRLLGMAISMIPGAVAMLGLWHLAKLFACFSRMQIFTGQTVRHFRLFATTVLVHGLINPVAGALLSLATSIGNAPGQRFVSVTLGDAEIVSIFLGIVLIVIAWVMEQGRLITEEHQQIV